MLTTTHTPNNNPFTIHNVEEDTYRAIAALSNPNTHADAFNALLTLLNTDPHICKNDMERYIIGYIGHNDIWDKAFDAGEDPFNYIGLSDAEAELLCPEDDPC